MKKIYSLSIALVLAGTGSLLANQVTFTGGGGYGPYQTGSGGEFTLRPDQQLSWVLDFYSPLARDVGGLQGTFQSFCVQKTEHIWPNATYDAVINNQTRFEDVPLTQGAAWVYWQFATGNLAGYDYATRSTAGALQDTIWWLMGNGGVQPINIFSTAVLSQFGSSGAFTPNNELYPVRILNLWEAGHIEQAGYQRQDQLVLDPPVPDAGTTLSLLAIGVGGLAFASRRARGLA